MQQKLNFEDKTTIVNYFKNVINPIIVVNDIANLIGAK